jgi:hypothetical protein
MARKTGAQRQAALKARREAEGKVKRPVWATPAEHVLINQLLTKERENL